MRRTTAVLFGLAGLSSACSRPDPHATPDTALRAYIAAADRHDVDAMRDLAIAPERLRRALACPRMGEKLDVVDVVANARETMGERADMRVEIVSIHELSRRAVAAGDDYRGCGATEPFEQRRLRAHLLVDDTSGGARRDKTEDGDAIRLDGVWWLVVPSS